MQPKIIVSKNKEDRKKAIWEILEKFKITQNNPDLFILDDEKIGIAQIKKLIEHFSTKPFGNTPKSAVILEGGSISLDAQNALLKTLEEPPEEAVILIGVDSENQLVPTILSRCLILSYESGITDHDPNFDLDQLINSSIEERFGVIEKTTDKEQFLENLTFYYRDKVLKGGGSGEFLEDLLQAQIWKEANVNIRTILEYLMLCI